MANRKVVIMDIEKAIEEGHVRSMTVDVFGEEKLLQVHSDECPCDRCETPVEVVEINGQLLVREKLYEGKLSFADLEEYGDARHNRDMGVWFIASDWLDIVRERAKAEYGVEVNVREIG